MEEKFAPIVDAARNFLYKMELLRSVTLRLKTLVVQSGDFVDPMPIIVHAQSVSTTDHKSKKVEILYLCKNNILTGKTIYTFN